MTRPELLALVAERILNYPSSAVMRVAIDGVDGAGKTTFADEIAGLLTTSKPIIRASVDSFHNPRAVRYRLADC